MNINGQAIKHKTFGSGIVTDSTASSITICFSAGEKKFIYPDAFKDYLVLKDTKLQRYIHNQIAEKEAEINRRNQKAQAEQEHRQKLLNFSISVNSHAAFHVASENIEQVCKTFTVSTGQYLSGYSKGQPRIAERLKPNSACLFTERPNGKSEKERRIVGAFMVREDFLGGDAHDGFVEAHPEYRMLLPDENPLLFWENFDQDITPRWGNTAFKYFSCVTMKRIPSKMVQILAKTKEKETALSFYQYFCKINRLHSFTELNKMEAI